MIIIWDIPLLADIKNIIELIRTEIRAEGIDILRDIKESGDDLMITCPFHKEGQESKPSCGISLIDKNKGNMEYSAGTVHCFTCGYKGDLPEFISNLMGYQDGGYKGYKWLMKNFANVEPENRKLDISISRNKKKKRINYIREEELEKFRYYHPYMYKRGLTDNIIDLFDIGYDKDTNCITFPVHDEAGNVLFIVRRGINNKYFNIPEGVNRDIPYGIYYIDNEYNNELWITEAILDSLTAWVNGKQSLAFMGRPTKEQIEVIKKLPNRKIILALDNDEAGEKMKESLINKLDNKLIYEARFSKKDLNDEYLKGKIQDTKIKILS